MVKELAVAGAITGPGAPLRFVFPRVDMPYESYDGVQVRTWWSGTDVFGYSLMRIVLRDPLQGSVRYLLRVTISKGGYSGGSLQKELEFVAQNVEQQVGWCT